MNFYQFHIGDYMKNTAHLSNEEDLAYRRLLDIYYDDEGPIPDDIKRIARRIRCNAEAVASVLDEFFELCEDGWRSKRCDDELAKYQAMKDGGRRGAQRRWDKEGNTLPKPSASGGGNRGAIGGASPPQTPPNANHNQEPVTNNQEPVNTSYSTESAHARTEAVRFTPPEKRETADFFLEHGSTMEEAGKFWHHYTASGWMLGNGRRMKSWQSAAHKWIINSKTTYNGRTNGTGTQNQRRNGTLADQQPIDDAAAARLVQAIADDPRYA